MYIDDFRDRSDVRRVLLRLEALFQKPGPAGSSAAANWGFKPDVNTYLGINGGNEWKLKATIYSKNEVLNWED